MDFGGNVRMLWLENMDRECIKFKNVYPDKHDNSTWSLCGSSTDPPRVVVGSNAYNVTVFNLTTCKKSEIKGAHGHNVPCVSFSPCGLFIASTSIDKSVKVWTEYPKDSGDYILVKVSYPSKDWGWAVQWVDKTKCELSTEIEKEELNFETQSSKDDLGKSKNH